MKKAGVIGHPISHSKSPLIHGYWLKKYGIDGSYAAYDLAPAELLHRARHLLEDDGLCGFNVTVPHKQSIMELCTTLTEEARCIGAVNTVVRYASGEIEGRNTDAFGFMENARERVPEFKWSAGPATVLGAGGAARAVIYALRRAGVPEIRVANRSIEKSEQLADDFGIRVFDWAERDRAIADALAIVNTTSLGMTGQPALDVSVERAAPEALVYEIVYAPLMTPLLQQASHRGLRTVTGIGMLLHQARPAFAAWFGGELPEVTDDLRARVLA